MTLLRVVIVPPEAGRLRALCDRAGLRVVGEAVDLEHATALAHERGGEAILHEGVPAMPVDAAIPMVVVGDDDALAGAAERGAFAVLPLGAEEALLLATLDVAAARANDLAAARAEAGSLRDQLETRKLVERAKGILMERLRLTEGEAYRKLQRASQEENRKMREIAESIVRTEKIMSGDTSTWPGAEPRVAQDEHRSSRSAG